MKTNKTLKCLALFLMGAGLACAQQAGTANQAIPKPLAIGKDGVMVMPNVVVVRAEAPVAAASKGKGLKAYVDQNGTLVNEPVDERPGSTSAVTAIGGDSSLVQTVTLSGGGAGAQLPPDMMNFSVLRKTADGKLDLSCVDNAQHARKTLQTKVAPAKEARHAK